MPTFKVMLYGEWDRKKERAIPEEITIEASDMEPYSSGALVFVDKEGLSTHIFAAETWSKAWRVDD